MVYLISYDLNKEGQDYESLYKAIRSNCSEWMHLLYSSWLVDSPLSEVQLRDSLLEHMDKNDRVFIVKVQKPYSGWIPDSAWMWLSNHT